MFLEGKKLLVVNAFANSKIYEECKPDYYVMADPQFWNAINPIEDANHFRDNVLTNIVSKTDWPLIIYIPYEAKKTTVFKDLSLRNRNISIKYYNKTSISGHPRISNFLFRHQLGMPRPQNVLIPSLMISIHMGFKTIYLAGADHNWHQNLVVNENNLVFLKQPHFYDDKVEYQLVRNVYTGEPIKLHDQFESLQITFKNYFAIRDFASSQNAEIINISEVSNIDAFRRLSLSDTNVL